MRPPCFSWNQRCLDYVLLKLPGSDHLSSRKSRLLWGARLSRHLFELKSSGLLRNAPYTACKLCRVGRDVDPYSPPRLGRPLFLSGRRCVNYVYSILQFCRLRTCLQQRISYPTEFHRDKIKFDARMHGELKRFRRQLSENKNKFEVSEPKVVNFRRQRQRKSTLDSIHVDRRVLSSSITFIVVYQRLTSSFADLVSVCLHRSSTPSVTVLAG